MEALLRVEYPHHVGIQAYADDIAVSVAGSTRTAIIQQTEQALQPILSWVESRGLSFSAQKSTAMMTKGFLVPGFTLAFGQEKIVSVSHTKYLGLKLDSARKWDEHIELLTAKANEMFSRLRGTMGTGWGIKRENLMILYRGVFLPRIGYGASFWDPHKDSSTTMTDTYEIHPTNLLVTCWTTPRLCWNFVLTLEL